MTLEEMKRIKKARGYSMAQLSKMSGIPVGTLQKIFTGETKTPRYATRQALEWVLVHGPDRTYRYPSFEEIQKEMPHEVLRLADPHGSDYTDEVRNANASGMVCEAAPKYGEAAGKKQGEYTIEDYYALPEDRRVELIDGVFYEMLAPGTLHQMLASEIFFEIKSYIKRKNGNCFPFVSPLDVRLDCDDRTMVEPDVGIVCDQSKIKGWGIMGAPDFVLEVSSKSTRKKDYTKKLQKYVDAGVREYWILDPERKVLVTYELIEDYMPHIHPLEGKVGLAIYDGDLQIDLDGIAAAMENWPE